MPRTTLGTVQLIAQHLVGFLLVSKAQLLASLTADLRHSTEVSQVGVPNMPEGLVRLYLRGKENGDAALGLHGGGCGCFSPLQLLNARGDMDAAESPRPAPSMRAAFVFGLTALTTAFLPRVRQAVGDLLPYTAHDVVVMGLPGVAQQLAWGTLKMAFKRTTRVHFREVALPFDLERVAGTWLNLTHRNKNCCGYAEFMKLQAFSLPYDRVLVVDVDIRLTISIDDLFYCPEEFLFSPGISSPLNGGFLVGPGQSPALVQDMADTIHRDSHVYSNRYASGWGRGMGPCVQRPFGAPPSRSMARRGNMCQGAETLQGFLWHYLGTGGARAGKAGLLNPCIYDFQGAIAEELCSKMDGQLRLPRVIHKPSGKLFDGLRPLRQARGPPQQQHMRRCAPSYFILGTRKGGTTALHTYLCRHPAVRPFKIEGKPTDGELFVDPGSSPKQLRRYNAAYARQLDPRKGGRASVSGESSVYRLMESFQVVPRACGYMAHRFIVLMRDPIERCHSQLLMRKRLQTDEWKDGAKPLVGKVVDAYLDVFHNRTARDPTWLNGPQVPRHLWHSSSNCIYEGIYVAHLRRWLYFVPTTSMRIYLSEDFQRNNEAILKDVMRFIGLRVELYPWGTRVTVNARKSSLPPEDDISQTTRRRLQRTLAPYNRQLERFLKSPRPLWGY